eukprot:8224711-Alexandrium_andersonii.AAC.1
MEKWWDGATEAGPAEPSSTAPALTRPALTTLAWGEHVPVTPESFYNKFPEGSSYYEPWTRRLEAL